MKQGEKERKKERKENERKRKPRQSRICFSFTHFLMTHKAIKTAQFPVTKKKKNRLPFVLCLPHSFPFSFFLSLFLSFFLSLSFLFLFLSQQTTNAASDRRRHLGSYPTPPLSNSLSYLTLSSQVEWMSYQLSSFFLLSSSNFPTRKRK